MCCVLQRRKLMTSLGKPCGIVRAWCCRARLGVCGAARRGFDTVVARGVVKSRTPLGADGLLRGVRRNDKAPGLVARPGFLGGDDPGLNVHVRVVRGEDSAGAASAEHIKGIEAERARMEDVRIDQV